MKQIEQILVKNGWSLDCESPLEISHNDGSVATNQAAKLIIENFLTESKTAKLRFEESMSDLIIEYEDSTGEILGCLYFKGENKDICFSFDGEKFVPAKYN